jgi:hypothetical protein
MKNNEKNYLELNKQFTDQEIAEDYAKQLEDKIITNERTRRIEWEKVKSNLKFSA